MVKVICDTSFLIHIANTRIKNVPSVETEIGRLNYVVPLAVLDELERLSHDEKKGLRARAALNHVKNFERTNIAGSFADEAISDEVKQNGGVVATMDRELKRMVKNSGGSVISIANDRIVLEQ